ncbi:Nudix hydrolase domain-containing protein [Plasmodiophora brassicae]|uniref:Nudix hydrolase domain-containing protein n=1 Tax=Plasmodiophora brassicae TaxID=37360 RepID=A0A0G4IJF3_PLABS|nr:hypothetical protein PBRA_003978 [Plasmodiophora brassicae]SPQ96339.1 unnamed protein product [Plasmodiophora brassicae]
MTKAIEGNGKGRIDLLTVPAVAGRERPDGADAPCRIGPPHDDSTVVIAVVVVRGNDEILLALSSGEACDPEWYIPSGDVLPDEDLVTAARRQFRLETSLELRNIRVLSVENYPSLSCNFIRFIVTGDLDGADMSASDGARWFPMTEVKSGRVPLLSNDIASVLDVVQLQCPTKIVPAIPSDPLDHIMIQVGVVIGDRLLFIRDTSSASWRLPTTFADHRLGESIRFAAQRLCVQWLGFMVDVVGVSAIEQGTRHADERRGEQGTLGSRLTVLVKPRDGLESLSNVVDSVLERDLWRWVTQADARQMTDDCATVATVDRLFAGHVVPILSI